MPCANVRVVCHWNVDVVCCGVSAMQTQLAQQHDAIKELEDKIATTTLEMIKVFCFNFMHL